MSAGRRIVTAVALAVLAVGLHGGGGGRRCGPEAAAAETIPPLTVQAQLAGVRTSITNWDQFAAANNISGWGSDPSIPPCLWTGVACDADGRLVSLSFACLNCSVKAEGVVPPITSATLATLNLQQNALGGPLPAEYAAENGLPGMINLILLDNRLTGSIPEEWGRPWAFPTLTLLGIGQNRLTGTLPPDLHTPALLILRANSNNFSGPLPVDWGSNASLPAVRVLALHANALTGALPAEWGEPGWMASLEELYLQNNRLTGGLPPGWGGDRPGLSTLRLLNVSNNPELGGTLPSEWSRQHSFPALRSLGLSNVGLQGTLPPSWDCQDTSRCGLVQLETLWVDGNNLSGPVPPSWSLLPALQAVFIRPGNQGLCTPNGTDFVFRLCDARGGIECRDEVQLPTCSPAVAAEAVAPPGAAPPPAAPPSGGSGSAVGAIVGAVVGGVAAVAMAAALALLLQRRKRRKKTERELPFYAPEELPEKSSEERSSLFAGGLAGTPPPTSAEGQPRRPSDDDQATALMLSPFAAAHPEDDIEAASGSLAAQRQAFLLAHSSQSSDAFLRGLMRGSGFGMAGRDVRAEATTAAAAADRALDDEMERHLSGELAAMQPSRPSSAAPSNGSVTTVGTGRTGGTGGTGQRATDTSPVPASQETSSGLSWEDSVPLSDWMITPREIEICRRPDGSEWELGSGGFGKVYKALRHGAQPVAVKVLAVVGDARYQSQEDFKREIGILRACRDPNIVAFLGASLLPRSTMLVTEYCDGGNLTRNLMAGRVTWHKRGKKIALDVARGLTYLHSRRIIHFDLKSPNILLARDGTAKISDVGMAKIMAREYSGVTGNVGTLAWAAPEMLLGARCTEKADIYSYGVVLWEICTGATPIRGQLRDVQVPQECPAEVRELILDCLATNPRKRPSAVDVVERLRAMPDATLSPAPPARRALPAAPGPALGPSRSARGRPGAAGSGSTAARLGATPITPDQPQALPLPPPGQAPKRLSSESDASLEAPCTGAELEAAYASPVPGSAGAEARLAAARLAAAAGDPAGGLRRSCSVLLAALPQLVEQEQPLIAKQLVNRASSSPPGDLLTGAPSSVAAVRISPPPERPRASQRQLSLDDPAMQAAELQRSFLQLPVQNPAPSSQEAGGSEAAPAQLQQEQQQPQRPPRPHPARRTSSEAPPSLPQQAEQAGSAVAASPVAQTQTEGPQPPPQTAQPHQQERQQQEQAAGLPSAPAQRQPSAQLSAFWARAQQHQTGLHQASPFMLKAHQHEQASPFAQAQPFQPATEETSSQRGSPRSAAPASGKAPRAEAPAQPRRPAGEQAGGLGGQQSAGSSGGSPPAVRLSMDSAGSAREVMEARQLAAKVALSHEQSRQQRELSVQQHQERQHMAWEHLQELADQQEEQAAAAQRAPHGPPSSQHAD
ncbi:hypothetical protein ABPG77_001583 [Micractinium sp. CCAP 211/92]